MDIAAAVTYDEHVASGMLTGFAPAVIRLRRPSTMSIKAGSSQQIFDPDRAVPYRNEPISDTLSLE
jgi:hypothetical protein